MLVEIAERMIAAIKCQYFLQLIKCRCCFTTSQIGARALDSLVAFEQDYCMQDSSEKFERSPRSTAFLLVLGVFASVFTGR